MLLVAGGSGADAAVRFAAPGGTGHSPCPRADPCSLFIAASTDAPAPEEAQNGDEVIVLPGEYSDAAGDFGPEDQLSVPVGVDVRGEPGKPRPVIRSEYWSRVVTLNGHSTISDLEIITKQGGSALSMGQSTAERIVARTSRKRSIACGLGFRAVLRDSICISTGHQGAGAGLRVHTNSFPMHNRTLRNVTAIGAGPESTGILFDTSGGEIFIDVKSTIAQGTATDVEAIGEEPGGGSTITLEASSYSTAKAVEQDGGIASVTEPGTNGNITAAPLLTADTFRQLPGSATIDQGVIDPSTGPSDIDGDARVIGEQIDIGADELALPTTTTVTCSPASLSFGQPSTCVATVETPDWGPPAGAIDFSTESAGAGIEFGTCRLAPSGSDQASCELSFPVMAVGPNLQVAAAYSGDPSHAGSQGAFQLDVAALPTMVSVTCAPASLLIGGSAPCSASVTNAGSSPAAPTGSIRFEATGPGHFWPVPSCTLAQTGPKTSGCQSFYTLLGAGIHAIAAAYPGDEGHLPSTSAKFGLSAFGLPAAAASPKRPRPNTRLKRRPGRRTNRTKAVFAFTSTQPGSRFRCKVDRKRYRRCRSPVRLKVRRGRHVFRVRAISAGRADRTPATFRWRVLR